MKISVGAALLLLILAAPGCKNNRSSKAGVPDQGITDNLIVVAENIITEIIVKPDPSGDPWEMEKARGFNGEPMFLNLLRKIEKGELRVYDCISGEQLSQNDARAILKETGSDVSKIAKMQFTEDWFFNPATNEIIKKVKSVSLGYESMRADGLPPAYLPYFRINTEQ